MVAPLTRKRSQEQDSAQPRIQLAVDGSSSHSSQIVQQPTHKRNCRTPIVEVNGKFSFRLTSLVGQIPVGEGKAPLCIISFKWYYFHNLYQFKQVEGGLFCF